MKILINVRIGRWPAAVFALLIARAAFGVVFTLARRETRRRSRRKVDTHRVPLVAPHAAA